MLPVVTYTAPTDATAYECTRNCLTGAPYLTEVHWDANNIG